MNPKRVVIAGGGASGIFAAIICAEANPDCSVTIIERSEHLLSKVKISGGGRCNVTHNCFEPSELIKHYPRGGVELRGPFHRWGPTETVEWFESRGVQLKTESDGRMFPVTDSSQTIIDCLLNEAERLNVKIMRKTGLIDVQPKPEGQGFWLTITGEETIESEKLLIAAGSLRSSKAAAISRSLGHNVEQLVPSLFTFHINDPRIKGLPGVSVDAVGVDIPEVNLKSEGPLLITHWGLSGPAILKASAWGAQALHALNYKFRVNINWLPKQNNGHPLKSLTTIKKQHPRRHVATNPDLPIPKRLWQNLVTAAGIADDAIWATLPNDKMGALAAQLGRSTFEVTRKSMNKEEFVTCGGIHLKEINFKTMESKVCPSLYYAGETLNIDGITGGFNFQNAWTTGYIAGNAMAEALL